MPWRIPFYVSLTAQPKNETILQDGKATVRYNGRKGGRNVRKEIKTAVRDSILGIGACRFEGISRPFPNHFHEDYVIGLVEDGERNLSCKNRDYVIGKGEMVLFNPGDNHGCVETDGGELLYLSFQIPEERLKPVWAEISGGKRAFRFARNVIRDQEAAGWFLRLHEQILRGGGVMEKEETFFLLLSLLLKRYGMDRTGEETGEIPEVELACRYMEEHYMEPISLEVLCICTGLGKSALLRAFARGKGITPYRYLETVRINEARKLLEKGTPPSEAALEAGFSDQNHFTNYFTSFTGLSPGMYRDMFLEKKGREARQEEKHGE